MSTIHISPFAYPQLIKAFRDSGADIALEGPWQAVSEPLRHHVDLLLCKMGCGPKSPVFRGKEDKLGTIYPKDVLYNAVVTESFIICNKKTVSGDLIDHAMQLYPNAKTIHVPQGYTKCNLVVIDRNHFITEDMGIYNSISSCLDDNKETDINPICLLISPGHVSLPGYSRGFIGGASGRVGDCIYFNGDISVHPDYDKIKCFIESCSLSISGVPGKKLIDIGSIIEE